MTLIAREDTFEVRVTVDGEDFGKWEKKTGGQGDSEETKVRLAGMGPQVSLGGSQTIENVTVTKLYDLDVDAPRLARLYSRRGKATVQVIQTPLDRDGHTYGPPVTWTGTLKAVTAPDVDAEGTDAAMVELEVAVDSVVA